LLAELGGRGVKEESGVGAAREAPDDVGSEAVVPGSYFFDDADGFVQFGDVGAEVVEALYGIRGCGLGDRSVRAQRRSEDGQSP
jgi:hypothetical protein